MTATETAIVIVFRLLCASLVAYLFIRRLAIDAWSAWWAMVAVATMATISIVFAIFDPDFDHDENDIANILDMARDLLSGP